VRDRILKTLARWHATHPWRMTAIILVITLICGALASRLTVTMRWSDLLPSGDRRTLAYNRIIDEFVSATSIIVVVQGEESRIKAFADTLEPRLLHVKTERNGQPFPLIRRVDYKAETDFLRNHELMLVKEEDLKTTGSIFTDPNITGLLANLNDAMEAEYVGQSESISTREKEDQAVRFLDGLEGLVAALERVAAGENVTARDAQSTADGLLLGDPYFLSYDKQALILNAIPNFSMVDIDLCVDGTNIIQSLVDETLTAFPNVRAGLTGFIPVCRDEMVYSQQSLGVTSLIAVAAIFILLVVSFRMWIAPLFAMANLLIGILWAIGVVALLVGQLNIMTQMMAVILLGLGIDFAIHLISGFTEYRAAGLSIGCALEETFLKSGAGVITGGLTTACAFMAMVISSSRGMKEMGLVTGFGLLTILAATFFILPIFMVARERLREKRMKTRGISQNKRDLSFVFLGRAGEWLSRRWRLTLLVAVMLTLILIWTATRITFDQNYMNIEPEGITSVALQDTVLSKFDMSMDYAMILTADANASRNMAKQVRDMRTVAMVEDISIYLPSESEQSLRRVRVDQIRRKLKRTPVRPAVNMSEWPVLVREVERLGMNIVEMQDMAFLGGHDKVDTKCRELVGDPDNAEPQDQFVRLVTTLSDNRDGLRPAFSRFQSRFSPHFKRTALSMASTEPIRPEVLPASIMDRFANTDRTRFLVTVFPAGNVWDNADFLHRFVADLDSVTDDATGMPPVFLALIDIIGRDGQRAMLLTLVVVFLLLWADFRSPADALFAMLPLLAGLAWMVGLMQLTGQQFTVMNVMGLSMILGIGIDDGVHIVHRWRAEGRDHIHVVFASTGKAILLTSLTTMLGFGSLIFSIWRGFGHLGAALFVGVGACFLTTVLFLSGIMGWKSR